MIYTYMFDLNHTIFFFFDIRTRAWQKHHPSMFLELTLRDKIKSVIGAFADEDLLANYLGISVFPRVY